MKILSFTKYKSRIILRCLLSCVILLCFIFLTSETQSQDVNRYNGIGNEVMLQGFHWTSYDPANNGNKKWYQIIAENAGVIKGAGFDYVWFPPPSSSAADNNSYLPNQWYSFDNGYGNKQQLKQAVEALKPTMALCDIVINHRCGTSSGGADFTNPAFGNGSLQQNRSCVIKDDECNCGRGNPEEKHTDGSNCEGNNSGKDLDHRNPLVQAKVKEFLQKLKDEIGFVGWRYDQLKGYSGFHVGLRLTFISYISCKSY